MVYVRNLILKILLDKRHIISGAGIQSAQHVVASGAQALVTGHLGPKAAKVIFAAGIAAYHADAKTVGEAVSMYKSKALKPMRDADVEGHWV
jgi:predicted Fe-Mo cluster-binding NifX family protein